MKDRFNFTKQAIEKLPIPERGKRKFYYDEKVPHLAVQVFGSGAKAFYMYRWGASKPLKLKIGPFPATSVEQARKWMEIKNAEIAQGQDPSLERAKKRAEMTFGQAFEWFMDEFARPKSKGAPPELRSWKRYEQNYANHVAAALGGLRLSEVSRTQVRQLYQEVRRKAQKGEKSGVYVANRVLALISVVFNKTIDEQLFAGPNPAAGLTKYDEFERERCITAEEMPRFLAAVAEEPSETIRDFIYVLLFTGVRRENVLTMRWEQLDLDNHVWNIPVTKNGTSQRVPLEAAELEVLRRRKQAAGSCPWAFPGRKDNKTGHLTKPEHGWHRILARAGITDLHMHDLRRTLGSWMGDSGASLPIIGKTLNHQNSQTTQIYTRISAHPVRRWKAQAHKAMFAARKEVDAQLSTQQKQGGDAFVAIASRVSTKR